MRPPYAALTHVVVILAAFGITVPATAQFSLYTGPGSLLTESTPTRQALEEDMANARWRFGKLRLEPSIGIEQLAYVDDVFSGSSTEGEPVSDITATLSAGLRGYLALGPKVTAAAFFLPSYVWWQDLEDRRQFNQRIGLGVFGDLNRLRFELEGSRQEEQRFITSQFEQLSQVETDRFYGLLEVRLVRSVSLFGSYELRDLAFPVEEIPGVQLPPFSLLDREEEILRAGLRFRLGSRLQVGLGVEDSQVDFLDPIDDRSNSGTSPLLILEYEGPRFQFTAEAVQRDLEPEPGSRFLPFDETTGQLRVNFALRERLNLTLYGVRGLLYTIGSESATATLDRVGLGLGWELGDRTNLRIFAETGEDDYLGEPLFGDRRLDDYDAAGFELSIQILRKLTLSLGVVSTDYDSNLPGFDRSTDRVLTRFTLGGAKWP